MMTGGGHEMIWTGIYILGGLKRKFRIEFNAYKNEWVQFPNWLRSALTDFIDEYGVAFGSVIRPQYPVNPTLEPEPVGGIANLTSDPEFSQGKMNLTVFVETMLWLESQRIINVSNVESTLPVEPEPVEPVEY
jgi:hypothetical protein